MQSQLCRIEIVKHLHMLPGSIVSDTRQSHVWRIIMHGQPRMHEPLLVAYV